MSVLIIDDEDLIRNLAARILQRAGINPLSAESGPAGLSLVSGNPEMIQLVIVDMSMPGMSGVDTIREIRRVVPDMRCILSTGYSFGENDIPPEVRPNTSYLQKPYRSQMLLDAVREMLPDLHLQLH